MESYITRWHESWFIWRNRFNWFCNKNKFLTLFKNPYIKTIIFLKRVMNYYSLSPIKYVYTRNGHEAHQILFVSYWSKAQQILLVSYWSKHIQTALVTIEHFMAIKKLYCFTLVNRQNGCLIVFLVSGKNRLFIILND